MPVIDVPVVDLHAPADVQAQAIHNALTDTGFFCVSNAKPLLAQIASVFAHSATFFNAPELNKTQCAYAAQDNFGYQTMMTESLDPAQPADAKETFTMRNVAQQQRLWPDDAFRSTMHAFFAQCLGLAHELQGRMSDVLGTPAQFFVERHSGENCTLRLLHYPQVSSTSLQTNQLGAGAHTDYGFMTLLFEQATALHQAPAPAPAGLEIMNLDGEWCRAHVPPQTIIVNAGDLLERWTNQTYRSTWHRVLPQTETERYSVAFFVDPDGATQVAPLASCVDDRRPARWSPIRADEFLRQRIAATLLDN